MPWDSQRPAIEARIREASRQGLIAAAQVYINGVKRELRGGYTSGEYVTGNVLNSVTRTAADPSPGGTYADETGEHPTPTVAPEPAADGMEIVVGTNVMYALYWELGWSPRSDRAIAGLAGGSLAAPSFRVPIWQPQLVAQSPAMQRAFERVYRRTLEAA